MNGLRCSFCHAIDRHDRIREAKKVEADETESDQHSALALKAFLITIAEKKVETESFPIIFERALIPIMQKMQFNVTGNLSNVGEKKLMNIFEKLSHSGSRDKTRQKNDSCLECANCRGS